MVNLSYVGRRSIAVGTLLFLFALLVPARMAAQVDMGSVSGVVRDPSGAAIPHAKVMLINEATGITMTSTSGSEGQYTFSPVKIGRYSVSASAAGFKSARQNNVSVDVQQKVELDLQLALGASTETVVVNEAPPLLQTQDASVGQVVEEQTIENLPLNGRNFTFLAQLSAGVTQGQQDSRGLGSNGSFAANGLRPAQNNYLLDGIDNNANLVDFLNGSAYSVKPPVDAIQEFKVETNNYSAESGRSAGAVLNATLKSGTNEFHGALWEFVRNDKFDAANYFEIHERRIPPEPVWGYARRPDSPQPYVLLHGLRRHAHSAGLSLYQHGAHRAGAQQRVHQPLGVAHPGSDAGELYAGLNPGRLRGRRSGPRAIRLARSWTPQRHGQSPAE